MRGKHLKDMVYGGIDGIITTFAVVSGVMGASLSSPIVLILGLANLIADGFSMAIGNYLGTRSDVERVNKRREEFQNNLKDNRELEVGRLKEILKGKGGSKKTVDHFIHDFSKNEKVWENFVVSDLVGDDKQIRPINSGLATFGAFFVAGSVPLISFILSYFVPDLIDSVFVISIILTGIALFLVGAFKTIVTEKNWFVSGLETLVIGGIAALAAFGIGFLLKGLVG